MKRDEAKVQRLGSVTIRFLEKLFFKAAPCTVPELVSSTQILTQKYFYYKLLIYSVNMNSNELSRREFLKRILALSAAAAMPTILTKNTLTAARPKPRIVGPNERVNLACCGIGNQGLFDIRELYKTGEANIVAFCDVDMGAPQTLPILKQFPNVPRFQDFRTMFDKMGSQIDAVLVSVPDFSHFPISMLAMSEGKHVFVEKPMGRTFYEVELMMKAQRLGISIPEDLSVMGYGALRFCDSMSPGLVSMDQHFFELGQKAALLIHDSLSRKNNDPVVQTVPPSIHAGESVGRPPGSSASGVPSERKRRRTGN